jgi:hypothetical protein
MTYAAQVALGICTFIGLIVVCVVIAIAGWK